MTDENRKSEQEDNGKGEKGKGVGQESNYKLS